MYPENDYRTYLEHSASHKYISKKMGRNGKWIYTYPKESGGNSNNAEWSKWRIHQDTKNKVYARENVLKSGKKKFVESYENAREKKSEQARAFRNRSTVTSPSGEVMVMENGKAVSKKFKKKSKGSALKRYKSALNKKLGSFKKGSNKKQARKNTLLTGGGAR